MRIIKFRIWCKVSNKYHYNWTKHVEQTDDDLLVWEQFTGLKDKNGKEIYEGDFVKSSGKSIGEILSENPVYFCGKVTWLRESWCLCQFGVGGNEIYNYVSCNCCDTTLEIIGNIHENPNLLN